MDGWISVRSRTDILVLRGSKDDFDLLQTLDEQSGGHQTFHLSSENSQHLPDVLARTFLKTFKVSRVCDLMTFLPAPS